ncbi:TnpV protein [Acaryochloris marina]|uniref:TnpV protein n=1 Tax=Acaryochloris marina TaxID=155978 RepID=UPI0021C28CCE|nr:TnpV protein [Acaryochloris marina]BDM83561.1 hypothetical protein AM10699_64220 [Acaryochloris marina MBIC10699]
MTESKNLPKWAKAYISNMKQYRPKTYAQFIEEGGLEETALSVQESAEAAYQQLVKHYMSTGSDASSAEAFANSDVMRQYICIEPSPDEFDDDDEIEDWDEMYGGIDEEDMVFSDRKDDDDG